MHQQWGWGFGICWVFWDQQSILLQQSNQANMSRLSSTFTKHRKDNYSLDIKGIYKSNHVGTPFAKKKSSDPHFFIKLKTQMNHQHCSMQASEPEIGGRPKHNSAKPAKMNISVGIENHLSKQKFKRIQQLFADGKHEECLALIRQLLIRQENQVMKNRLFWFNSICLQKVGRIKEAEHFLTRLLNEQQNNYEALIQRAKIRYILGAYELSVRDLRHAIYTDQNNEAAYIQLTNMHLQEGDQKQAYNIAVKSLENGIQSTSLLLVVVQLLLTNSNLVISTQEKANIYINQLRDQIGRQSKDSADLLYLQALLYETKDKLTEACIYYEECLKFNNSKNSVTKSLQRLILIKIMQRDYYSAYHTVNRFRFLSIQTKLIQPYILFLEGVILVMKKKYHDGIRLFDLMLEIIENRGQISQKNQILLQNQLKQNILNKSSKEKGTIQLRFHHNSKEVLQPLMLKFTSYAAFKVGNHERAIQYYEKLSKWGLDQCSSYNMLLAEGIVAVEKKKNFQLGMEKFQQARYVYPCKVQPSIYVSMTVIYRDLYISGKITNPSIQSQTLTSAVIHAMQQLNQAHQTINNSSSNLLFHRCMLILYLQDWQNALSDINLCIDKAQENEPKYFYLRGLCYAVVKELKRAINQYSISLSLDSQYDNSLLERAKCYFLLGETETGFSDLKQYMHRNQGNVSVHKWIGDLLFQGKSYSDALKAYTEIEDGTFLQAEIMKCKCMIRINDLDKLSDCLTRMSRLDNCEENKIQVDILAVGILKILARTHENKELSTKIKKLNGFLEESQVGYVFGLIDCMNLLGVATMDSGRYEQAYQSFLLVLQLFTTLFEKNKSDLKSDCSEQSLSLTSQDIYLNIICCLIGMKQFDSAIRIIGSELLECTCQGKNKMKIKSIIDLYNECSECEVLSLQPENRKNSKIKFKEISLKMKNVRIKSQPIFALFHECMDDLYSKRIAKSLLYSLRPSYIDNMPEGPWIKRNEHGVIFTDNIIEDSASSDFLSSMRAKQSEEVSEVNSRISDHEHEEEQKEKSKREQIKKKLMLDSKVEQRLNSIINKTNR